MNNCEQDIDAIKDVFIENIYKYELKYWGHSEEPPYNASILNQRLNYWEQTTGRDWIISYPTYTLLPAGDQCNLQCIFCTPRGKLSDCTYNTIKYDDFLRYSFLVPFASNIQIQGFGEPLLNKDYDKIFSHVVRENPDALINFNTNGTLLNKKWFDMFAKCSHLHVNVSLNASTPERYHEIMSVDTFDKVCKNIKVLTKIKGCTPTTSFIAMKQTIDDFPSYIEHIHELGIKSMILRDLLIFRPDREPDHLSHHVEYAKKFVRKGFKLAEEYGIHIDDSSFPTEVFIKQDKQLIVANSFLREDVIRPAIPRMCNCCDPWTNFFVGTNGDITICCERPQPFGNIYNESFDSIWNGTLMRGFRRTINSTTPPMGCRTCVKKMRAY